MFRIGKTLSVAANVFALYASWQWLHSGLSTEFSLSCLLLSGIWLALTHVRMKYLLQTYFDILSRAQVCGPVVFGVLLSGLAFFSTGVIVWRGLSVASFLYWGYLYWRYRRNKKNFETVGHGPLPAGAWLNVPLEALLPGDILLTSGRIASKLRESVGHGEIVVRVAGKLMAFSSYMLFGAVLNPLEDVVGAKNKRGHYIVLRPLVPWSEDEILHAELTVLAMIRENRLWAQQTQARRDRFFAWLPLPAGLKAGLREYFRVSGYDWFGLFTGRRVCNRWTCIGAVQELLWRMGRVMRWLGTGIIGLGSLFNPIMPCRFLAERTLRTLLQADRLEYEAGVATADGAVTA